jgi:glutaredoxin-related protein
MTNHFLDKCKITLILTKNILHSSNFLYELHKYKNWEVKSKTYKKNGRIARVRIER